MYLFLVFSVSKRYLISYLFLKNIFNSLQILIYISHCYYYHYDNGSQPLKALKILCFPCLLFSLDMFQILSHNVFNNISKLNYLIFCIEKAFISRLLTICHSIGCISYLIHMLIIIQYIQYYSIHIALYVFLGITRSGKIWYIQYIQYYKYYVFTSVCTQFSFVSRYIISCFFNKIYQVITYEK